MHSRLTLSFITATLLLLTSQTTAQSGRASLSGFVAFEGLAYVDKQPTAKIELFSPDDPKHPIASAETSEHGLYDIPLPALGELTLRISAPGYTPYQTTLFIPSDFQTHLGTLLKKPQPKPPATQNK